VALYGSQFFFDIPKHFSLIFVNLLKPYRLVQKEIAYKKVYASKAKRWLDEAGDF
jgi:hypothetical protein